MNEVGEGDGLRLSACFRCWADDEGDLDADADAEAKGNGCFGSRLLTTGTNSWPHCFSFSFFLLPL